MHTAGDVGHPELLLDPLPYRLCREKGALRRGGDYLCFLVCRQVGELLHTSLAMGPHLSPPARPIPPQPPLHGAPMHAADRRRPLAPMPQPQPCKRRRTSVTVDSLGRNPFILETLEGSRQSRKSGGLGTILVI